MSRPPVDRRLQMQIIYAFMVIYALLLFVIHPNPTRGQVAFRLGMAALGLAGFTVVSWRNRR